MRKFVTLLIVVVVVLGLPLTAAGWSGVVQVPVVSSIFGNDHARNLAMPRDRQAFETFCGKWGIQRPSDPANYTLSSPHHWDGSVEVDGILTEAALGSIREFNSPNPYLDGVNFRIHSGYVEIAAFVKSVPGYPLSGPLYGRFSIARTGNKTVSIDISQLRFGNVDVPSNYVTEAVDKIGSYLNAKIADMGINMETIELREGGVYYKGTWPKTISADPPASGQVP